MGAYLTRKGHLATTPTGSTSGCCTCHLGRLARPAASGSTTWKERKNGLTIDEVMAHLHALGRNVWHLQSDGEEGTASQEVAIIVEDKGRALVFDIGWGPEVGVHANVRAISGGDYAEPDVFVLDDAVMIAVS